MLGAPSVHNVVTVGDRKSTRRWHKLAHGPISLEVASVPETRALLDLMRAWDHGDDARAFARAAAGTPLVRPVNAVLGIGAGEPSQSTPPTSDPLALETAGLIDLASGRPREALRSLERAVRIAPAMSRLHWAVAVASLRVGWSSAAMSALNRADTLLPSSPIIRVTAAVLGGAQPPVAEVIAVSRAQIDALGPFQLALLGVPTPPPTQPPTMRGRFSAALLQMAARTAQEPTQDPNVDEVTVA
jgi:hypothetical protein